MKATVFKLAIPLTIISFIGFTKWWYVYPVDAPDSIMLGFPLPYSCNGWHTSMSSQFFILEFLFDLFVYFIFWILIIFLFERFVKTITLNKIMYFILYGFTIILLLLSLFLVFMPENLFYLKRDFDIEVKQTQFKFMWENISRPEIDDE